MSAFQAVYAQLAPSPRGAYSPAVLVGNFLFVSGQLPLDRAGRMVQGTVDQEVEQALDNIRFLVEAAGGSLSDIAQCTVYINDISLWTEVNRRYRTFFDGVSVLPARTIVPVKELHCGARIEIQAIAILRDCKAS